MRTRITFDQVLIGAAVTLVSVALNLAANLLGATPKFWQVLLIGLAAAAALLVAWLRRPTVAVRFGMQIPLHAEDYPLYARRGLIAILPALGHPKSAPGERKLRPALLQAAQEGRYADLDFEHSTFEPLILAAGIHHTRLEHCWLIATGGESGSEAFAPALCEYLRREKGLAKCEFHLETVDLNDDEALLRKVRDRVDRVFKAAAGEYGLPPGEMIADFTNGPRSIAAGMLLGCIDGHRDVQFIGTRYTDGIPTGSLKPMLFRFEAQVIEQANLV